MSLDDINLEVAQTRDGDNPYMSPKSNCYKPKIIIRNANPVNWKMFLYVSLSATVVNCVSRIIPVIQDFFYQS